MFDEANLQKLKALISTWNGRRGVDDFADLRIAFDLVDGVSRAELRALNLLELTILHDSVCYFQKHCAHTRGKTALVLITAQLLTRTECATEQEVRRHIMPLLVPNLKPSQLGQDAAGLKFRAMDIFGRRAGPINGEMNVLHRAVVAVIQYHTHTYVANDPQRDICTRDDLLRRFNLFEAFISEVHKSGNGHDLLPTIT